MILTVGQKCTISGYNVRNQHSNPYANLTLSSKSIAVWEALSHFIIIIHFPLSIMQEFVRFCPATIKDWTSGQHSFLPFI
jgi:hypothetical protein